MMKEKAGFTPLYLIAALYVIGVYAFVPLFYIFNMDASAAASQAEYNEKSNSLPLLIPLVLGAVNLIAVLLLRKRTSRAQLLNCALAVKYALIPFFILGGLCIAAAILLMFTPVVIMVFVGPAVAVIFSVAGWLILLGSAPFSIGYLVKARQENVHHKALCIAAGVLQFFFTADVISMMVLVFKEKKWILVTAILLLLVLAAILILGIWLALKIAGSVL